MSAEDMSYTAPIQDPVAPEGVSELEFCEGEYQEAMFWEFYWRDRLDRAKGKV